jgi:threonine aldolase
MQIIDLRSDTVTVPTPQMREFIAKADVGDDVYGEDPTVNELQKAMAELTGKEAALFVTSGTQANQLALKSHTKSGDEVICEYFSHTFNYEAGAAGMLSGIQLHPLKGNRGVLHTDDIKNAIRPADHHFPQTRLICLENTHNRSGGSIYPLEEIRNVRKLADRFNLTVHLDGARLWNASVATGVPIREYAKLTDSLSLCFSKGLGAPVGSILAGSDTFIERAHYFRKAFGGGMRQAGLIAAGALYAVEHHFPMLEADHRRAQQLADAINQSDLFEVDIKSVETNIIMIDLTDPNMSAHHISKQLKEAGILISAISEHRLRAVTHLGITDNDLESSISIFSDLFQ